LIFSRFTSSASSTLSVISPSAWPVITAGPAAGERRKSNISPCSESSSTFDFTGNATASNWATRRLLAASIFAQ
jgi:hypothetical protein